MPYSGRGRCGGMSRLVAEVSARTGRRRGGRAALRRRVLPSFRCAEGLDLAPLPGGDRGARHLLRPASRAGPDHACPPGGDPDPLRGGRAGTLTELRRYTKLFWINSGPYNHLTARKFVLKCSPGGVGRRGPGRGRGRRAVPDSRLARPSTRCSSGCGRCSSTPTSSRSSPTRARDRARTSSPPSANNLYVGVTMDDLKGFAEQYPAQLAAGQARRQARRGALPVDGRYGTEIRAIVGHLEAAARWPPSRRPRRSTH